MLRVVVNTIVPVVANVAVTTVSVVVNVVLAVKIIEWLCSVVCTMYKAKNNSE